MDYLNISQVATLRQLAHSTAIYYQRLYGSSPRVLRDAAFAAMERAEDEARRLGIEDGQIDRIQDEAQQRAA